MTDAGPETSELTTSASGQPRAVRTIVAVSATLYFLQATLLARADMLDALGFASSDLGHHWWTVLTFTVVHSAFWPMAVNLVTLGVFGSQLERRWGSGEFVRYYLTCSLGAWIAHATFVAPGLVLAGAAAPAIGVMLAYAAGSGNARHLRIGALSMSAGWLTVAGTTTVLVAGVVAAEPLAASAYLAHGAGLGAGWAYLRTASSVNLVRLREGVLPVPDEPDDLPPRAVPRAQPRMPRAQDDVVARSNAAVAREAAARDTGPQGGMPSQPKDQVPLDHVLDHVLDKISAHGLDSLTIDERKLLDDMSRRLRDS